MTHDFIIVGGGSAGSVLANRLSAKSGTQVLLLEAGQDTPHGKIPPEVLDSYPGTAYFDPRFHWTQLKVRTEVVSHNNPAESPPPLRKYEQARILGGGSSINGQLANRGAPADFEEWVARGARGWGWKDVLPFYKKVERDMDFDGPLHGKEGRIPVRRIFPEHWTEHAKASAKAFHDGGLRVPARPERRVEERLLSDHDLQRLRAARLGRHRLPRSRHPPAPQPEDLDRHAGGRAAVRGQALRRRRRQRQGRAHGVQGARGDPLVRRHPLAGPPAARRHRAGRASEGLGA